MGKHNEIDLTDETGPQTFEEALEFALRGLAEPTLSLPPEWLAALNREKESSSS